LELSTPEDLYQLADAPPGLMMRLRRLKSKVKGAFAVRERTIYLDMEQPPTKLRFTQGHELGHRALPWHDDAYYGDDDRTLHPDTTDELEAEANAFSAELLFNMAEFTNRAHSTRLGIGPALELAEIFETSRHAAIRHYVEDSPRPCALIILGRHLVYPAGRPSIKVLRSIESTRFHERYGPAQHYLPSTLPIDQWQLARDAVATIQGTAGTPVLAGSLALADGPTGSMQFNYEMYSNTYLVFLLLMPTRRFTFRPAAQVQWRPSTGNALRAEITG
jgi:hypothetical protein